MKHWLLQLETIQLLNNAHRTYLRLVAPQNLKPLKRQPPPQEINSSIRLHLRRPPTSFLDFRFVRCSTFSSLFHISSININGVFFLLVITNKSCRYICILHTTKINILVHRHQRRKPARGQRQFCITIYIPSCIDVNKDVWCYNYQLHSMLTLA